MMELEKNREYKKKIREEMSRRTEGRSLRNVEISEATEKRKSSQKKIRTQLEKNLEYKKKIQEEMTEEQKEEVKEIWKTVKRQKNENRNRKKI